jgi:hypothetical protein
VADETFDFERLRRCFSRENGLGRHYSFLLTAFGKAVLAGTDDFSRHNPVHRWWGGTELTNDRLWRWDPVSRSLIAP